MKQSDRISYEKPTLSQYGFFGVVSGAGGLSQGGDNPDEPTCESGFDDD